MWADNSVFYQIYPLGFCGAAAVNPQPAGQTSSGAPKDTGAPEGQAYPDAGRDQAGEPGGTGEPDGIPENGADPSALPGDRAAAKAAPIRRVMDWTAHIQALGADAVYFCPLLQSDAHGYDTRDFYRLDVRLGDNADFQAVCDRLHAAGIRVVLDGVFNHVGRGFWAFQDLLQRRESSPYKDWFHVDFGGNSPYNDGLWYEGWEGHYELVRLNLRNPAVVQHILGAVEQWVRQWDIDGLRLDVAYLLDRDFIRRLRAFCDSLKPDFFLVGEMLHGDYNQLLGEGMLHSVTNYECYKGLYSSFNSLNLFEIGHSLSRQFGPEDWTLYKGRRLLCFADNHDVSRVASILQREAHLPPLYALLFAMPGIPCVYYGSEWGAKGRKEEGDPALRPCFGRPEEKELTRWIARCAAAHKAYPALWRGDFRVDTLTNRQLAFLRQADGQRILAAVNADEGDYTFHFKVGGRAVNLLDDRAYDLDGGFCLPPFGAAYLLLEK